MKTSSELMPEALQRARNQWRRGTSPLDGSRTLPCTIAISREAGAGGGLVARELGRRRGWAVYDHELLDKISAEPGLRSELLESLDEKTSHWLFDSLEAFGGVRSSVGGTYARHLAETMLALSDYGECAIVGRGATMLLPPARTFRVRLVAPLEYRVSQVCDEQGITERAAREFVERTDRDRAAFVEQFFRRDVTDMHHYDLAVNTSRYSIQAAAALIDDALEGWRARQRAPLETVTV